jgi:hypothetical protein
LCVAIGHQISFGCGFVDHHINCVTDYRRDCGYQDSAAIQGRHRNPTFDGALLFCVDAAIDQ